MAKIKVGGDPKKSAKVTKPTPAELEAANKFAKSIALRRGLISGENTHTGGQVPRFYDSRTGKDITGQPDPTLTMGRISDKVPLYVNSLEWDEQAQLPYYVDEKTGDTQYVNKDLFYSPRFRKTAPPLQNNPLGNIVRPI